MGSREEINEKIAGLKYNPGSILAFQGNKVQNFDKKSGYSEGNEYIVVTREKCTVDGEFDISIPAGNMDVTYPGALLLANSKLVDGKPQPFGAKRGKTMLTLNLPGMTEDSTCEVAETSYGTVLSGMNKILNRWYESYGGKYQVPANMSYVGGIVSDRKEMQLKFGCDVAFLEDNLKIDFDAISKKKTSVYLVKYMQVFYSASVKPFAEPADAFADGVTVKQLENNGMNNDNPPAYVGSVVFGREIYLKFESTCSESELSAAIKGAINVNGVDISADIKAKYLSVYQNTNCSLIAMGGSPVGFQNFSLADGEIEKKINKVIFENVELSSKNPAYPLTYKVYFLKDNAVANFYGSTEYVKETSTVYSGGELHLSHSGAYVARFHVNWKEIKGYDKNGNMITENRSWNQNGSKKTAGFSTVIAFEGNVRDICVKAEGATGLVWNPWQTSFNRNNMALVPNRTIKIWGTTLNQKSSCTPD